MTEINVNKIQIEVRSAPLTKALLKQFRELRTIPGDWLEEIPTDAPTQANLNRRLKPERVVGWVHGSVLGGDSPSSRILVLTHNNDYYIYKYDSYFKDSAPIPKGTKQIYL